MTFDYSNHKRNEYLLTKNMISNATINPIHHSLHDEGSNNQNGNDMNNDNSEYGNNERGRMKASTSTLSFEKSPQSLGSTFKKLPTTTSTGTTIVGLVFKDGVILGADTRATSGPIVADKNCEKIHYIAERIWCCGAGTAADTEYTTQLISNKMELHRLNSNGRHVRVTSAMTQLKHYLFQYQGHVGAALILGGVDPVDGIQLYSIYPHGSVDKLPYCTMGSGSLAAMSVFESGFHVDMSRQDGIDLVSKAILAGIFNDLGSGSNVDILIIPRDTQDKVEYLRNYQKPNAEKLSTFPLSKGSLLRMQVASGTTRIISEKRQMSLSSLSLSSSLIGPSFTGTAIRTGRYETDNNGNNNGNNQGNVTRDTISNNDSNNGSDDGKQGHSMEDVQ